MKKWIKGFAVAGIIMFCAGIGMTALAGVVGGVTRFSDSTETQIFKRTVRGVLSLPGMRLLNGVDGFYWGHRDYDFDYDDIYDYDNDYDYDDDLAAAAMPSRDGMTAVATYQGITNLELDVQGGRVQILENPDLKDQIVIYEKQKQYCAVSHVQSSDTSELEIRYYITSDHNFSGEHSGPEGIIEIPSGYRFAKASIDLEASAAVVPSIKADKLELDVKAGDLLVTDFDAGVLEVDVQAGSITASGNVTSKVDADVDVGALALCLSGSKTDFNYDLEGSGGTIKIDTEQYTGFAFEQKTGTGAPKTAKLSSDMGTLELTFK